MSYISVDEDRIKEIFKQAIIEVLQDRKELIYNLFTEVLEDFALVNAIKEGESTKSVSREDVFKILEGAI
jgi:hypothetical protein